MKNFFVLLLILILAMPSYAIGEDVTPVPTDSEDRVAQLEEELADSNERIAELESQLEEAQAKADLYYSYYEAQIVAEYDGGEIFLDDARAQYDYWEQSYASMGYNLLDFYDETEFKQQVLNLLVQEAVVKDKAAELGLDQVDDDAMEHYTELAKETTESNIEYLWESFNDGERTDEEIRQAALDYLDEIGYGEAHLMESYIDSHLDTAVYNYITKDVEITDEEVSDYFSDLIASDEELYSDNNYQFEYNYVNGELICWNPEGYRLVKQVLIGFDEDQAAEYDALIDEKNALAEDDTEGLAEIDSKLDELYSSLEDKAKEVISEFNGGANIDDLILQYGSDSQMLEGIMYPVSSASQYWQDSFTEGAMSIEEPGQISSPVRTSYGVSIIYYDSDITSGEVEFTSVEDRVREYASASKVQQVYTDTLNSWVEEANPVYYIDRFVNN